MIAFMMIRGGLPVVPGVIAMVTLAGLGGIFLSEYTQIFISFFNSIHYYVQYAVETPLWWINDGALLVGDIGIRDETGNVIKTVSSLSEVPNDAADYTYYPSELQLGIDGFFEALKIPYGNTSAVVTFMIVYMMTEFFVFYKVLKRIAVSGEEIPDIKQRFEIKK